MKNNLILRKGYAAYIKRFTENEAKKYKPKYTTGYEKVYSYLFLICTNQSSNYEAQEGNFEEKMVNFHIFQTSFVLVRELLINYGRRNRQLESTSQEEHGVFMDIFDMFEKAKTRRIC